MLSVSELMIRDVVSVKKDTPIYEVLVILRKNNIADIPVVDNDLNLVGVITEKDVLRLIYPNNDQNKTVESFMIKPAFSFGEEESLESVCDFMEDKNVRTVPVVCSKGKLLGIVTRQDIIEHIILQKQINALQSSDTDVASPVK